MSLVSKRGSTTFLAFCSRMNSLTIYNLGSMISGYRSLVGGERAASA